MSKIISDKEIKELAIHPPYGFEDLKWIAKAQRDSSNREWIDEVGKMITQLLSQMFIDAEYHDFVRGRWQALKQKVTGE